MSKPLSSLNTVFFRHDARVEDARKHPAWKSFHRACGQMGLYFDDIERIGTRGTRYSALAFRVEPRPNHFNRYSVAKGEGDGPIGAVLDALAKAGPPWATNVTLMDAALLLSCTGESIPAAPETEADAWENLLS